MGDISSPVAQPPRIQRVFTVFLKRSRYNKRRRSKRRKKIL
jgi:hypothetical protein